MSTAALILASKSSGRLTTLRAAGVSPLVLVSEVDEPAVLEVLDREHAGAALPAPTPAQQVQALARAKALDVAGRAAPAPGAGRERTVVVGCDSMLEINGEVVGKPRSDAAVRERWTALAGSTGTLYSGHAVVRLSDGALAEGVSRARVSFGSPTPEELEAYVATGEPQYCAGAFTIDGYGAAFVDAIEGDPHGVVGVSLPLLRGLLAELGVRWTDLWDLPAAAAPTAGGPVGA